MDYFYIIEQTGAIYLKKPLTDDTDQVPTFDVIFTHIYIYYLQE